MENASNTTKYIDVIYDIDINYYILRNTWGNKDNYFALLSFGEEIEFICWKNFRDDAKIKACIYIRLLFLWLILLRLTTSHISASNFEIWNAIHVYIFCSRLKFKILNIRNQCECKQSYSRSICWAVMFITPGFMRYMEFKG